MADLKNEKLLSSLGLCKKAGKLVMGFDAVAQAMQRGEVHTLALAKDLSPKSAKEIAFLARRHGVPIAHTTAAMDEFKRTLGKKAGILAITDEGLAGTVARQLEEVRV